jgi:hypothetical protein
MPDAIDALLARHAPAAEQIKGGSGGNLPPGNYCGTITNGELRAAKDPESKSVQMVFTVKVDEGDSKGKTGFVQQNIFGKTGDINAVGIGIVKDWFLAMFGKTSDATDIKKWKLSAKKAIGFRFKFRVSEDGEYTRSKVTAVLPKAVKTTVVEDEESDSSPDVMDKVAEVEGKPVKAAKKAVKKQETEEVEEVEETEVAEGEGETTLEQITEQLGEMDRAELKAFIVEQGFQSQMKVLKSDTDDMLRKKIVAVLSASNEEEA